MTDAAFEANPILWLANSGCYGMGANGGPSCISQETINDMGRACDKPCWACIAWAYLGYCWWNGGRVDSFCGIHDIALEDVAYAYHACESYAQKVKELTPPPPLWERVRPRIKALIPLQWLERLTRKTNYCWAQVVAWQLDYSQDGWGRGECVGTDCWCGKYGTRS